MVKFSLNYCITYLSYKLHYCIIASAWRSKFQKGGRIAPSYNYYGKLSIAVGHSGKGRTMTPQIWVSLGLLVFTILVVCGINYRERKQRECQDKADQA